MFSFFVEEDEEEEKAWLQHVFGTRMQLDEPRLVWNFGHNNLG